MCTCLLLRIFESPEEYLGIVRAYPKKYAEGAQWQTTTAVRISLGKFRLIHGIGRGVPIAAIASSYKEKTHTSHMNF